MTTNAEAGGKGAGTSGRARKLRLAAVGGEELARRLADALFERFQAAFHIEGKGGGRRRVYLSDADFYGGHDRMRAFVAGWLKGQRGEWVEAAASVAELNVEVWAVRGGDVVLARYVGEIMGDDGGHAWLVLRGRDKGTVVFDVARWCHLTPPIQEDAGGGRGGR
jgi:hypothetical protein